jgi:methionyl-tRNA formyltransferase
MNKMRIFLFGGGVIMADLIQRLSEDQRFDLVGLHPRQADGVDMALIAREKGIPYFPSDEINSDSYLATVEAALPDLIVSCNEKLIFRDRLIAMSRVASLNIHDGVLPLQRGGESIYSAFVNKQPVGMTVHHLSRGINEGDIILQTKREIAAHETALDIQRWYHEIGGGLYYQAIDNFLRGKAIATPQSGQTYTYVSAKPEFDEFIDWTEPSELIHNKIRGRKSGVLNFSFNGDHKFFLLESALMEEVPPFYGVCGQVIQRRGDGVVVKTGDGAILIKKIRDEQGVIGAPTFRLATTLGMNPYAEIARLRELTKPLFFYEDYLVVNRDTVLRALVDGDFEDVHRYSSNPLFAEHLDYTPNSDSRAALTFINMTNQQIKDGERLYWGIEYSGKIVGTIGFLQIDASLGEMELGFGISPELWGSGVVNRCFRFLLHRAFSVYRARRLIVGTVHSNIRCQGFVQKEGFAPLRKTATHSYYALEMGAYREKYCCA